MKHQRATPSDIKQFRERYSKTQTQLAQDLGVTRSTISRWERGVIRIPSVMPVALRGLTHIYASRRSSQRSRDRNAAIARSNYLNARRSALSFVPDHIAAVLPDSDT